MAFSVQWAFEDLKTAEAMMFLEGFVHRDGLAAEVTGARRVVAEHRDGYPSSLELTMTDELGRTTVAFGDTVNTAHFRVHPTAEAISSLTRWIIDGKDLWGGDHEAVQATESPRTVMGQFGPARVPTTFGQRAAAGTDFEDSVEAVVAATRQFCQAVESGDFMKMQPLWEHTRRVVCVLPGRHINRGWSDVANAWIDALSTPNPIVVGNLSVSITGEMAWVHYDCDVLQNTDPPTPPTIGVASSTYAYTKGKWLIVAHHASTVSAHSRI